MKGACRKISWRSEVDLGRRRSAAADVWEVVACDRGGWSRIPRR